MRRMLLLCCAVAIGPLAAQVDRATLVGTVTDATGVKDPRQEAALRLIISTDSIAEFRVNASLYSAESGSGMGGQVHLVSKTGSNQWHGGAFEYLRNSALDARTIFDGPKLPPFKLNQFGANLAGRS